MCLPGKKNYLHSSEKEWDAEQHYDENIVAAAVGKKIMSQDEAM